MLPEGPAVSRGVKRAHQTDETLEVPEVPDLLHETDAPPVSYANRVFRTIANAFGLFRQYPRTPSNIPDDSIEALPTPEEGDGPTTDEIISPFPNLSAFRFSHVHSLYNRISDGFSSTLSNVISSDDFVSGDIKGLNWGSLREKVSQSSRPWEDAKRGWRTGTINIGIPNLEKGKKNPSPVSDPHIEGEQYTVNSSFWYRPILPLLKSILSSDESKAFHYEPFEQWWRRPGTTDAPIRVYDELFTADAWLEEHQKVQEIVLPADEVDNYPRAIAAIMLWSDSTHLAEFGQQSLWPIYLSLGNQSKYDRAKPGAQAMHHIAYLPSVNLIPIQSCELLLMSMTAAQEN